ncbi:TauD/TfdA family dioxygenase [Streptomyces profundus]|uniref:TauD/TfdA family dioxygenase n=1 Tax=Streptomyces profundus TaxID=2867410 RepID=UPI001D16169F|nr:TauD/TfdA family dioxygenase [Streptomyces sp. MA3_2.13]UED85097.1 TauD/TfdA family dioxygenase [Streptomyces sp. MA3_2.13]
MPFVQESPHVAETHLLTLSAAERRETEELVTRLAAAEPGLVDDHGWVSRARRASCELPLRLRDILRQFRHDPSLDGLLILRNLPIAVDQLPPTPEGPELHSTVPATVAMLVSLQLGEVAGYREGQCGALVQNVVPVPGRVASRRAAGASPLELQVENAWHPQRPDYVGLLCLRGDQGRSAGMLVSSIRRTLRLLPVEMIDVLRQPRFSTAPASRPRGAAAAPQPILSGDPADPNVIVDFHATVARDSAAKQVLEALRVAFLEASTSLMLKPGEMVFVDNRVAIHGRTAYTPRFDGTDRWLHRTLVHLDARRTRSYRAGNGNVLV